VKLANSTYLQKTIARSLTVTQAGLSFLESGTKKYIIRYPVELQHMSPASVQEMFSPHNKSTKAAEKVCSMEGCSKQPHAKSFCFKHYQADLRAKQRPNSAPAVQTEKQDSFVSSADSSSEHCSDDDDDKHVVHEGKFHPIGSSAHRSSSCPSTPQSASSVEVLVRPNAVRNSDGITLSPPEMRNTPKKSPSPSTSDTSSDEDDIATECLSIDGQFYPGTLVQQYMTNPPVRGTNSNIFILPNTARMLRSIHMPNNS